MTMMDRLTALFSLATTPTGLAAAGVHRSPTPEQAYRKRVAKKHRKAQKKSRRRNRK